MTTNLRAAAAVAMIMLAGQALAQQAQPVTEAPAQPPVVSTDAPAQAGVPAEDTGSTALPAATGDAVVPPAAPASGAPADAPAAQSPSSEPAQADAPVDQSVPALAGSAAGEAADGTPEGRGRHDRHGRMGNPNAAEPVAPLAPGAMPTHSMRLDALFLQAHWVVQSVMAGLAVAAFAALVIFIQKTAEFSLAFGAMRKTAKVLARSSDLHEAATAVAGRKDPSSEMIRAADEELRLAEAETALLPGVRERSQAALARIEAGMAQKLRAGTGILASIGSLAPFVGLFGTVFGIMNSFIAIAETKTTNLAVVAPGIAEALLATAVGLAAAIPAVLIYNICSRRLAKYRHRINDIAAAALRLQSRALDRLSAGV